MTLREASANLAEGSHALVNLEPLDTDRYTDRWTGGTDFISPDLMFAENDYFVAESRKCESHEEELNQFPSEHNDCTFIPRTSATSDKLKSFILKTGRNYSWSPSRDSEVTAASKQSAASGLDAVSQKRCTRRSSGTARPEAYKSSSSNEDPCPSGMAVDQEADALLDEALQTTGLLPADVDADAGDGRSSGARRRASPPSPPTPIGSKSLHVVRRRGSGAPVPNSPLIQRRAVEQSQSRTGSGQDTDFYCLARMAAIDAAEIRASPDRCFRTYSRENSGSCPSRDDVASVSDRVTFTGSNNRFGTSQAGSVCSQFSLTRSSQRGNSDRPTDDNSQGSYRLDTPLAYRDSFERFDQVPDGSTLGGTPGNEIEDPVANALDFGSEGSTFPERDFSLPERLSDAAAVDVYMLQELEYVGSRPATLTDLRTDPDGRTLAGPAAASLRHNTRIRRIGVHRENRMEQLPGEPLQADVITQANRNHVGSTEWPFPFSPTTPTGARPINFHAKPNQEGLILRGISRGSSSK